MYHIFQKEVENTEECTPLEPSIIYSIEFLPEQFNEAKRLLQGAWYLEEDPNTLQFKNKRQMLKGSTTLVLKGIKIVKTSGL